jgi:predicted TIM-barrel fold metal-dependent hydrolase
MSEDTPECLATMLIIDTHAHIYAGDERRYPPIDKPLRPPGGKGTLGDLRATAASHGVRGACLIQTSTFYRFDNRYICDSAKVSSDWAAGVCTLDPDDPHSPDLLSQSKRERHRACAAFRPKAAGSTTKACAISGKSVRRRLGRNALIQRRTRKI